ncbi:MAG TPA: hypothetical protein VKP58_07195 [Candidatus Acidoferrum sp.]|nr:hypothetical protein [Candidatus Acidoferrum sp.]
MFIQCSPEVQSNADRCTIYRDDSGEILADGLFVIPKSGGAASPEDLHYAAFGIEGILLANAQILSQKSPSSGDPGRRILVRRLNDLASKRGGTPINCNYVPYSPSARSANECVENAIATKTPFFVESYDQRRYRFLYVGIVGDAQGTISEVEYASSNSTFAFPQRVANEFANFNRITVQECSHPLDYHDGLPIRCAWPSDSPPNLWK